LPISALCENQCLNNTAIDRGDAHSVSSAGTVVLCSEVVNATSNEVQLLARDVIYTSRAYAAMAVSVCLTEVHWRIIANLAFKFLSKFTAHCGRGDG